MEHDADGQTGEQNIQSDTAVELAGEASERDQAKEVLQLGALGCHLNKQTIQRLISIRFLRLGMVLEKKKKIK